MDKRNLAMVCAAALTFWMYALAFGTATGYGLSGGGGAEHREPAAVLASALPVTQPLEVEAAASPSLNLNCRAALLMDQATGAVLYEKNADTPVPIASITKVMTLLLTFEALQSGVCTLEDTVPVSRHAYSMGGSQIWLEPGEVFTLDEMLRAICVSSANDAAVAVAEFIGGSEELFVQRMNERAAQLGMTNTHYCNACGLDASGHLSSARDVAVLSRQILLTCPDVLKYSGIWTDSLRNRQTQLVNTNKLLKRYEGITGLKTGTTGGAGVCISATATRDGLGLIAVVLGAPSSADRFNAATALLDYGFANYRAAALPALEGAAETLPVRGGEAEYVALDYSRLPRTLLLKKDAEAQITAQVLLPEALDAPVQPGEEAGTVRLYSGETLLGEYPVLAAEGTPALTTMTALRLLLWALADGGGKTGILPKQGL